MGEKRGKPFDSSLIVGLIIIVVGALLLLEKFNIETTITLRVYWPSLLILFGIYKIWAHRYQNEIFSGAVLLIVGTLFQLNNLGILTFGWGHLWPLLIILAGVMVMLRSFGKDKSWCCSVHSDHGRYKNNNRENREKEFKKTSMEYF